VVGMMMCIDCTDDEVVGLIDVNRKMKRKRNEAVIYIIDDVRR
jgi:hypothetical protein